MQKVFLITRELSDIYAPVEGVGPGKGMHDGIKELTSSEVMKNS